MTFNPLQAITIILTGTLLLLLPAVTSATQIDLPKKRVLLLNSYHQGMTWVDEITDAAVDTLKKKAEGLVFHIENMDTKRHPESAHLDSLYLLYKARYGGMRLDLVLASDNNAFDFLMQYRDELFPGAVIVFCGVNDFKEEMLAGQKDITGVAEVFDAARTLEIALKIHPGTKNVFIVNDYLKTGRAWERVIRKQLAPFSSRVTLQYVENMTLNGLENQLSSLSKDSLVLFGVYFSDQEGKYFTYEQIGKVLASSSSVPVYCLLDFNIGPGVVGGRVTNGYAQGLAMASLAVRILDGENPNSLPVVKSGTNRNIFNYDEIVRFKMDEALFPEDAQYINKPSAIYELPKHTVWSVVVVFLVFVCLIVCLCILLQRNRQARHALKESQVYNRSIFEETPVGLALCRMNGELVDINPAYARIIGYTVEEAIRLDYWQITPEKFASQEQEQLASLESKGRYGPYEKEYRRKDGSLIPVRLNGIILGRHGQKYILSSVEDVTDRIRAEQVLYDSMDELRSLLHSTGDPFLGVDLNGNCVFCNPAALGALGLHDEREMHGENIHEMIYHSNADGTKISVHECASNQAIRGGEDFILEETVLLRADGSSFMARYSAHPIVKDGVIHGATISFEDITERKKRELETLKLSQMASIGELAAGVAHEINNPITGIINYAQLLINRLEDESHQELSQRIIKEGNRIASIVRSLLHYSHQDNSEMGNVQVSDVISEVLMLLNTQIEEDGIRMKLIIDPELPKIKGNFQNLEHVIINLINNSRYALNEKYQAANRLEKMLQITAKNYGHEVWPHIRITVKDQGSGIPEDMLNKIMTPFVTTKPAGIGTGLGLNFCYNTVNQHNGTIAIQSQHGEHTTVTVCLPLES